jgi:hypothetical protein
VEISCGFHGVKIRCRGEGGVITYEVKLSKEEAAEEVKETCPERQLENSEVL